MKKQDSFWFTVSLVLLGIFNSVLNVGMMMYVLSAVQQKPIPFSLFSPWGDFIALVALSFIVNRFFQTRIIRIANERIFRGEIQIFNAVRSAALLNFERIGIDRVYAAVDDLRVFSWLPNIMVNTINSFGSIVVCLGYFVVISPVSTLVVSAIIGCFVVVFLLLNKAAVHKVKALRALNDSYHKILDDMLKGFKQVKMSSIRTKNLFDREVFHNREASKNMEIEVSNFFLFNNLIGGYGLYVVLGIVLFAVPVVTGLPHEQLVSFLVILLFISGPVNHIISMRPFYAKAGVARKRIDAFIAELESLKGMDDRAHRGVPAVVDEIRFEDVYFKYTDDRQERTFELGPVNFSVRGGETVFIIGGNGSGKSTFINLLTGLYQPTAGLIYVNNTPVDTSEGSYRDIFSAVFTNNFLFSRNYEDYQLTDNMEFGALIRQMKMEKELDGDYREHAVRRSYSKGQSKRMSMIFALMEKRPLLILDEWAADQDPAFRRYFYEHLLSDFKRRGKVVVAVTHDDAYFKHADRIVKFDSGTIAYDVPVGEFEVDGEHIKVL